MEINLNNRIILHLTDQDNKATQNIEIVQNRIQELESNNEFLKKEVKNNRKLQFIGFGIILIMLAYLIIK